MVGVLSHSVLGCCYYSNAVVQSLSHVQLFAIPWTAAHQASLSFTISWNLLKLMSIESVMLSNHLILCRPLLLLSSIFPSTGVFFNELVLCIRWSKFWSFSFIPKLTFYSSIFPWTQISSFLNHISSWLCVCRASLNLPG